MNRLLPSSLLITALVLTFSVACSDTDSSGGTTQDGGSSCTPPTDAGSDRPGSEDKLAIAGVWESQFGGNEVVTDQTWQTPYGTTTVQKFNNDERWLITQNASDIKDYADKFNRVVWTAPKTVTKDGLSHTEVFVCTVSYGLDSLELAQSATETADDSDPAKSGCGGFSWTRLTTIAVEGTWTTNFCSLEVISRVAWSKSWLRGFVNAERVAYTQNPEDASYAPGRFNKLVWTTAGDGSWHYCTVDFDLETLEAAKASDKTADAKDLNGAGCGGFPWTQMTP